MLLYEVVAACGKQHDYRIKIICRGEEGAYSQKCIDYGNPFPFFRVSRESFESFVYPDIFIGYEHPEEPVRIESVYNTASEKRNSKCIRLVFGGTPLKMNASPVEKRIPYFLHRYRAGFPQQVVGIHDGFVIISGDEAFIAEKQNNNGKEYEGVVYESRNDVYRVSLYAVELYLQGNDESEKKKNHYRYKEHNLGLVGGYVSYSVFSIHSFDIIGHKS